MRKKSIVIALVVFVLAGSANSAYAQFWKKWFNKDEQVQEAPAPAKNEKPLKEKEVIKAIQEKPQVKDKAEPAMKIDIKAVGEQKGTPEDAEKSVQQAVEGSVEPQVLNVLDEVDDKEKAAALRKTQEQVDQMRKIQEINRNQRSLDNIKRINEMNRQRKQIEEINKLNKMQKK